MPTYYETNKDKILNYQKIYNQENHDKYIEYQRQYYANNKTKFRKRYYNKKLKIGASNQENN